MKMDTSDFGRIAAQTAKQVIIQKVRDAERDILYTDYKDKVGEIVTGVVQRFEKGDIIINLGRGEAILQRKEQIRKEGYRQGDRVRALVLDVNRFSKGPQVTLSRSHPHLLKQLFEMEVPEIYEKLVEIKGAAREPGERAKIAVVSHDRDVDAVGACVGMKGMRVQSVVQELKGEKIDIVSWREDPAEYVCNALSPAQVATVMIDDSSRRMEVIVPDDQLSLAVGRKGQNVRLAAKLTGWRIDINSESEVKKATTAGKDALANLPGVSETMSEILFAHDLKTVKSLAETAVDDLTKIPGVGQKTAEKIIAGAVEDLAGEKGESAEAQDKVDLSAEGVNVIPGVGAKTVAVLTKEGFKTVGDILSSSPEKLAEIDGIGTKKAASIFEEAKKLVE
jgi:N utilization substance protein A